LETAHAKGGGQARQERGGRAHHGTGRNECKVWTEVREKKPKIRGWKREEIDVGVEKEGGEGKRSLIS